MTIGEKLRSLRVKTKKTLKEQSKLLGVSLNSVYRWEHDMTFPKKSTLRKIVDIYGVPLEWLLHDDIEEDNYEYASKSLRYEDSLEHQLLMMFVKLPEYKKHKVLGYIERMYVEDMDAMIYQDPPFRKERHII